MNTAAQQLAREPGAPTQNGISLSVPELRGNEWKYIKECLDTNWVSSVGAYVDRFERMVAERVGARYGIATVNGTAALHIALMVAGVQADDAVLVSDLSFIAPANAVRYLGALPIFIDVEPTYWQMNPQRLADFLANECMWRNGALYDQVSGRRVRALLPVHILGHPVKMGPLLELARKYELVVIEDATEGLGAKYYAEAVGHLGDIACFSFNGNKLITTGGGGMIVTDNAVWAERAKYLTTQAKDDLLEYIHGAVGYNYRLPNVLAAMGVAQMECLDEFICLKREIADRYTNAFQMLPGLELPRQAPWAFSTFWLYTIMVNAAVFGMDSRRVLQKLGGQGIQTRPLWQPLHQSTAHPGSARGAYPVAEQLNVRGLSLPCSVGLSSAEQARVIDALQELSAVRE